MKIVKLNCTACGAPITIPEDVDQIVCTSCGTVLGIERGEGYVALKIADKLAKAIESSGSQTQDAIRESAQVTRSELQKLQLSQELSAAQMQLNGIQAEIRVVERGPSNIKSVVQIATLRNNEYQVMEQIRLLKLQISTPDLNDIEARLALAEWELSWIASETSSLRESIQPRKTQLLADLSSRAEILKGSIYQMRVDALKERYPSFGFPDPVMNDEMKIREILSILDQDEKSLRNQRNTPEGKAVYEELGVRQKQLRAVSKRLELERIRGELTSLDQQPDGDDLEALKRYCACIEQDLQSVSLAGSSDVARDLQRELQENQKRTLRQINALERANTPSIKSNPLAALLAGIETGTAEILSARKSAPSISASTQQVSAVEPHFTTHHDEETVPSTQIQGIKSLGLGCLFGLLTSLGITLGGFVLFAILSQNNFLTNNMGISVFLLVCLTGVVLGSRTFLQRIASMVRIKGAFGLDDFVLQSQQTETGIKNKWMVKAFVGLSTCISVFLLVMAVYAAFQGPDSAGPIWIIFVGILLGPLTAWWVARRTISL